MAPPQAGSAELAAQAGVALALLTLSQLWPIAGAVCCPLGAGVSPWSSCVEVSAVPALLGAPWCAAPSTPRAALS